MQVMNMGNYAHGNQPVQHMIYLYNYAGEPWKAQYWVREVMNRLYLPTPDGYCGDEDNGQMSAWYILSALGIYPLNMGSGEFAIGAPLFTKATIKTDDGKTITVNAPNNSKKNKYVKSMRLNGKPYNDTVLQHSDFADGAVLDFEMTDVPTDWGKDGKMPHAFTPDGEYPTFWMDLTNANALYSAEMPKAGGAVDTYHVEGFGSGNAQKLFDNHSGGGGGGRDRGRGDSGESVAIFGKNAQVTYYFAEPKTVQLYTITSASREGLDPTAWKLSASADGNTWTVIDERKDEAFTWRQYTRPFALKEPKAYPFYRLDLTNGTGDAMHIAELEFLG
jgi:hypothetical protein